MCRILHIFVKSSQKASALYLGMKTNYIDLIDQTFYFPQDEFELDGDCLTFHGIDLMGLIEKYGTPLRLTYLPRISHNIQRDKKIFSKAMK